MSNYLRSTWNVIGKYLRTAWKGMGDYAGQLQTIIAVIALLLAILAYYKVLDQIKISINQMQISEKQRDQEVKINFLNLSLELLDKNNSTIKSNNRVLTELKKINLKDKSQTDILTIKAYIDKYEEKNKLAADLQNLIFGWIKQINENDPLNNQKHLDNLKTIYDGLIVVAKDNYINEDIMSTISN